MEKMLNTFIEKNKQKEGFLQYLTDSYSPILKDYYLKYDLNTYNEIVGLENQQKLLHNFMEEECINLFDFCYKNNIDIIGLKGIFQEKQFWTSPRYYNDIDVIVDKSKINKLYEYFRDKGTYTIIEKRNYNPFKMNNSNLSKMLDVDLNKTHHIVLWNQDPKYISCGLKHIEIEIHGCFDTFNIVDINDEYMFKDCKKFNNFNVLDTESQILYLIFHTIQHLPYIRHNLTGLYVEINRFVDVALIILNKEIDWDKFEKLATIHSMNPLCSFYFKMFNEIFPDTIPDSTMQRLDFTSLNMDFYWKNIYLRLMKMNPLDLIIGNFDDFPEIQIPYTKIKNHILKGRYDNKYILKCAMEIWKLKLANINSKL